VLAKDTAAVDQLEWVKKLQTEWSDNAVSCTVYYRKDELNEIRAWLRNNYNSSLKSVSFLLHQDHGFVQAPYEEISHSEYAEMKKHCRPILKEVDSAEGMLESMECATGVCPIK
jgi:ribonucleoside-triphosphate reductase